MLCEVREAGAPQIEGWQVLRDATYGFQIQYPGDWTYEEGQLLPVEERPDGVKALQRLLFFQPKDWDGVAPPLHIQVTEGTQEEFDRLYVPATSAGNLEINGREVIKEIEDIGSGMEVIRYIFQSPTAENVRVVALDYLGGFPERATGNEQVMDTLQQVLSTLQFSE